MDETSVKKGLLAKLLAALGSDMAGEMQSRHAPVPVEGSPEEEALESPADEAKEIPGLPGVPGAEAPTDDSDALAGLDEETLLKLLGGGSLGSK